MTTPPETPRPSVAASNATTGFEIFERLVAEAAGNGGTSPTLSGWATDARERLAALRAERMSPTERRAADRIEAAFQEAEALLRRCLAPSSPDEEAQAQN